MPVVLDTGLFVGALNMGDRHHERAKRLLGEVLDGQHGTPIVPDAVVTETLTFLRRHPGRKATTEAFLRLLDRLVVAATGPELLDRATASHLTHWGRRLSGTDCVAIEHARAARATAITFESNWSGLVPVL